MHELSIAEHLIEAAQNAARAAGALAVVRLRLRLGALAGVDPQALRFCFDVAAQGTLLDGAAFDVEEVAAHVQCRDCGTESMLVDGRFGSCERCGSTRLQPTRGREMEIVELEIVEAEREAAVAEGAAQPECAA